MSLLRLTPIVLSLAGLAVACSDDPAPPPPSGSNKDATVTATGADADAGISGNPDAAPMMNVDAGPTGPCNRVTGGNCNTGESCYYSANLDQYDCRIPMGMPLGGNEVACNLGTMDCEAGFHCFSAQGLPSSICLKGCDNNTDCDGLVGSGTNGYFCASFNAPSMPKFCIPRPDACDVYTQGCPMNGNCTIINQAAEVGCVPSGTVAFGGGCQTGRCATGGHCLDLNSTGPKCYAACNAMNMCPMGAGQCATIMPPLPWGGLCVQ